MPDLAPNLMPREILDDVIRVLSEAPTGKGTERSFLTAYQILDRLPEPTRALVIEQRGLGGQGSGVHYSASSVVSGAIAQLRERVDTVYLDTEGLSIAVYGEDLEPGYSICAIYRLK